VTCNLTADVLNMDSAEVPLTFLGNCSLDWENPVIIQDTETIVGPGGELYIE